MNQPTTVEELAAAFGPAFFEERRLGRAYVLSTAIGYPASWNLGLIPLPSRSVLSAGLESFMGVPVVPVTINGIDQPVLIIIPAVRA